jgi:hypothetical protein
MPSCYPERGVAPFTSEIQLLHGGPVHSIWRSRSTIGGGFMSIATGRWSMVFSDHDGRRYVSLRGPERAPTPADCPPDGNWVGLELAFGTHLPAYLKGAAGVDAGIDLPAAGDGFWLGSERWEVPDFENADVFVRRVTRAGLLHVDPLIHEALRLEDAPEPERTLQRRFLSVTGLSHTAIRQVERARAAAKQLLTGAPILDVAYAHGFFDQPHLTRAMRRYIGATPEQLRSGQHTPLSLL